MCMKCQYDLSGLDQAGTCPECNVAIADSMRITNLAYSNPVYIAAIARGAWLMRHSFSMSWGIFVVFAAGVFILELVLPRTFRADAVTNAVIQVGVLLLFLAYSLYTVGCWLLTVDESRFAPGFVPHHGRAIARWLTALTYLFVVALVVSIYLMILRNRSPESYHALLLVLCVVAGVSHVFFCGLHMHMLGKRLSLYNLPTGFRTLVISTSVVLASAASLAGIAFFGYFQGHFIFAFASWMLPAAGVLVIAFTYARILNCLEDALASIARRVMYSPKN